MRQLSELLCCFGCRRAASLSQVLLGLQQVATRLLRSFAAMINGLRWTEILQTFRPDPWTFSPVAASLERCEHSPFFLVSAGTKNEPEMLVESLGDRCCSAGTEIQEPHGPEIFGASFLATLATWWCFPVLIVVWNRWTKQSLRRLQERYRRQVLAGHLHSDGVHAPGQASWCRVTGRGIAGVL